MRTKENAWRLVLLKKCQNYNPMHLLLSIGNTLEHIDCEKLLGVHIDPSLQFNKHADHVCRSITSKIALLRRIKDKNGISTFIVQCYSIATMLHVFASCMHDNFISKND